MKSYGEKNSISLKKKRADKECLPTEHSEKKTEEDKQKKQN